MNMGYDIYSSTGIEVNLVLFTIVDNQYGLQRMWSSGPALSLGQVHGQRESGYSLCVVTMKSGDGRGLPSGGIGATETLLEAAHGISENQLGLRLKGPLRQLRIMDKPLRAGGEDKRRIISVPFWGFIEIERLLPLLGGRDQIGLTQVCSPDYLREFEELIGDLDHFDGVSRFGNRLMPDTARRIRHQKTLTDELPSGRILYADHDDMVFYAWRALRHAFDGKLDPFRYLGVNPLSQAFRLSDLKQFVEVCRGERLQKDYFRRAMTNEKSYLKPLDITDSSRPGKPAILYTLEAPPEMTGL